MNIHSNADERTFLDLEPFDREYTLADLLPLKTVQGLFENCGTLFPQPLALFHPDGSAYTQYGDWDNRCIALPAEFIFRNQPVTAQSLSDQKDPEVWVSPIEFEMEPVGYLAIIQSQDLEPDIAVKGRAVSGLLQQMMRLEHKTLLTSGLHGEVVESSYAQLKEKADQLAVSEEKYRRLAANLEIEVQKQAEEIRTTHAHLMHQEKLAAIGQLSAGMAHEINNPLGFIISNLQSFKASVEDFTALAAGYRKLKDLCRSFTDRADTTVLQSQIQALETLEKDMDLDFILEDIPAMTQESLDGARRIQKIVSDLKTVARPGVTKPEQIDLRQSLEAVLSILSHRIGPGLRIEKDFHSVPLIPGHAQQLNQVWFSLLLNALDAVGDQGIITLSTRSDNEDVVVSIADTGCGIAREHLPRIFDPFFTTKDVGKGTGLGLHLAHNLVNRHDGRITVQSTTGQGTTFEVHLPVVER